MVNNHGFIRVGAAAPSLEVSNTEYNLKEIKKKQQCINISVHIVEKNLVFMAIKNVSIAAITVI
jgi:hypothetical protein